MKKNENIFKKTSSTDARQRGGDMRWGGGEEERQTDKNRNRQTDWLTDRRRHWQTDGDTDRQTGRQAGRQANRNRQTKLPSKTEENTNHVFCTLSLKSQSPKMIKQHLVATLSCRWNKQRFSHPPHPVSQLVVSVEIGTTIQIIMMFYTSLSLFRVIISQPKRQIHTWNCYNCLKHCLITLTAMNTTKPVTRVINWSEMPQTVNQRETLTYI